MACAFAEPQKMPGRVGTLLLAVGTVSDRYEKGARRSASRGRPVGGLATHLLLEYLTAGGIEEVGCRDAIIFDDTTVVGIIGADGRQGTHGILNANADIVRSRSLAVEPSAVSGDRAEHEGCFCSLLCSVRAFSVAHGRFVAISVCKCADLQWLRKTTADEQNISSDYPACRRSSWSWFNLL